MLRGTPTEEPLASVHIHGATGDGAIAAGVVETGSLALGLDAEGARRLAEATRAVARAVYERGFDDPTDVAVDVSVLRAGHEVVVHVDDQGLPFAFGEQDAADAAVVTEALAAGWIDRFHHESLGREGNRTVLARHLPPGEDIRDSADPAEHEAAQAAEAAPGDIDHTARLAVPDDAEAIARLTWRTYGYSYQHDEYYQPERLASMIASGQQVSFVTEVDDGEVVGHSAVLFESADAVVCEAGRAMVDPRFRGHHLMQATHAMWGPLFAERGIIAMLGAAVTAHTRSQQDGPISGVELGFLPPIAFRGIEGTETQLREAVLAGFIPWAPIPHQEVVLPERDAAMITEIHRAFELERTRVAGGGAPSAGHVTKLDVDVHADLGHAVLDIGTVGADLADVVRSRTRALLDGGIEVVYADLRMDDTATSWAADVLAEQGFVFSGVVPLLAAGVDVVRYQRLGDLAVDRDAIQTKAAFAATLLDYVLAQLDEIR